MEIRRLTSKGKFTEIYQVTDEEGNIKVIKKITATLDKKEQGTNDDGESIYTYNLHCKKNEDGSREEIYITMNNDQELRDFREIVEGNVYRIKYNDDIEDYESFYNGKRLGRVKYGLSGILHDSIPFVNEYYTYLRENADIGENDALLHIFTVENGEVTTSSNIKCTELEDGNTRIIVCVKDEENGDESNAEFILNKDLEFIYLYNDDPIVGQIVMWYNEDTDDYSCRGKARGKIMRARVVDRSDDKYKIAKKIISMNAQLYMDLFNNKEESNES